jgi:hypothetical protein
MYLIMNENFHTCTYLVRTTAISTGFNISKFEESFVLRFNTMSLDNLFQTAGRNIMPSSSKVQRTEIQLF